MARFVALAIVATAACSLDEPSLDRFPCEDGQCTDGFVCHPETNECVIPVELDPTTIQTGTACENTGSFLPCDAAAADCSAGCRTCGEDSTWSECSTGCGELGRTTQCAACGDDCTTLPNVELATCEPSAGGFRCVIARCADGFQDASLDAPGCECQPSNGGLETCDGVDNDCDGEVDDFTSQGSLDLSCGNAFSEASNVTRWSCETRCVPGLCDEGFFDIDGDSANGCEYACTPAGEEVCDGIDNDCNGTIDDPTPDALNETCETLFPGALAVTEWACGVTTCEIAACRPGYSDDDGLVETGCEAGCVVSNGGVEICDDADNDCNGVFDDEGAGGCTTFYLDQDGDGFGIDGNARCLCAAEDEYRAQVGGDCDDEPTACGATCFPGASAADVCDGDDFDCDGVDGEDDPALGSECDGFDSDVCENEVIVGCFDGALFCGAPCSRDGNGMCVDNAVPGCSEGNATCGPGDSIVEQCNDAVDDDCDGLNNCADSDCLSDPACVGFEDTDGDGFTTAPTAQQDCDDTVPTCTSDCTSNADAGGESEAVPDCVERYCGSDPTSSTSSCRLVSNQSQLSNAINASNAAPGRDFILIAQSFTVTNPIPDLTDPAGVEIRQVAGTTVSVDRNEPLLDDSGNDSQFEHLRIRYVRNVTRGLRFIGARTRLADVRLTHAGSVNAEAVLIEGADGQYERLVVEAEGDMTRGVLIRGDQVAVRDCSVADVTAGGGVLSTAVEVEAARGTRIERCAVGEAGVGYQERGIWIHGSGDCGTNPAERSSDVWVLDSSIVMGQAPPSSARAAVLVCDSDAVRVVGNLIASAAHDGIVLDGAGLEGQDATGPLLAFNTVVNLGPSSDADGVELSGTASHALCLTQSVFSQNAGASFRSTFSSPSFSTTARCLPAPGAPYRNLSVDTTICAGDCGGCSCLPGGDASRVYSVGGGDPGFVSTSLSDPLAFCPGSSSVLLDAGVFVDAVTPDRNGAGFASFNGSAPDLGAREAGFADCP